MGMLLPLYCLLKSNSTPVEYSHCISGPELYNWPVDEVATLLSAYCYPHPARRLTSNMLARYILYTSFTTV